MIALKQEMVSRSVRSLNSAISYLAESLNPGFWSDDLHLTAAHGDKVFISEAGTVLKLQFLIKERSDPIPDGILREWIDRIITSDRLLAAEEIDAAANAGVPSKQLGRSSDKITEGDSDRSKHHYVAAILHYRQAWKSAMRLQQRHL
jgi:hypothetical protein